MARSTLRIRIEGEQDATSPYLDEVRGLAKAIDLTVLAGNADNQMSRLLVQEATIAGAGSATIDLQTGTDAYGAALSLADVALLYIECKSTSVGVLSVSAAGANGFTNLLSTTAALKLSAGDFVVVSALTAGNLAVSGTNKAITLSATGGDVDYSLHAWGRV